MLNKNCFHFISLLYSCIHQNLKKMNRKSKKGHIYHYLGTQQHIPSGLHRAVSEDQSLYTSPEEVVLIFPATTIH